MERFAVIDLGSNTFHILITEKVDVSFKEIYRHREYTKLAMGGSDMILDSTFKKGIDCLVNFRQRLDEYKVKNYKAIGTAALRSAHNGDQFIREASEKANIIIQLIDGNQEASYIASGVKKAVDIYTDNHLIMDIGGGSVEFIIVQNGLIKWQQSFPIGLAILKSKFHQEEPISQKELEELQRFLDNQLEPLKNQLDQIKNIHSLIGASGSFEVVQAILDLPRWNQHSYKCHVLDFFKVKESVMLKSPSEREKVKGLPPERVDLIIVALFLMNYVLHRSKAEEIQISDYALKEGVITEHYESTNI